MGIGFKVELPAFGRPRFRVRTAVPAAWIEREVPFDEAPRFLVSVFLIDQPGLLARILAVLDEGIGVSDSRVAFASENPIRFSIDGSLASSVRGALILTFVVRPVLDQQGTMSELAFYTEHVPDVLRMRISEALSTGSSDPSPAEQVVRVFPFQGLGDELFAERRFTEYRFGIRAFDDRSMASITHSLSQVAATFADDLGDHGVPIAYLYFPDDGDLGAREGMWLRVGVGAPTEPVESLDVDLIAYRLAERYRCACMKYDPWILAESMGGRFREITKHENLSYTPDTEGRDDLPGLSEEVDGVFAHGPARTGYVGDMLRGARSASLLGGSMTVLAGHTVSCWVLARGAGSSLADHIESLTPPGSDVSMARVFWRSLPVRPIFAGSDRKTFWLAWKCSDEPGILRRIVDVVRDYVASQPANKTNESVETAEELDFRYVISRVLADGVVCAGKMKFAIPTSLRDEFASDISNLEAIVRETIIGDKGKEVPVSVIVRDTEPGEEPWASLLVGA